MHRRKIQEVTWNGERVAFQRSGNYIYFGAAPSMEDTTQTPETGSGVPVHLQRQALYPRCRRMGRADLPAEAEEAAPFLR